MAPPHIVVDGSNIATEGRSAPSLAQLEQAVAELRREHPGAQVTVIVDATFAHRIDPSELERFEKAALAGEYVHPPAGAIGRGDAFLLRVAEKVGATVLSNDSFQEFHGEHPWLFEQGRLLGATPVPGVGWIFSPRSPVRGPTSRQAMREVERARRQVSKAIKEATKEAVAPPASRPSAAPKVGDRRVPRSQVPPPPETRRPASPPAVNDPLTFVSFIAEHPLGAEIVGHVESYTSHGAVVMVGSTQCYVPLANLADPPPRSAREVLKRGEEVTFVVHALDPQRRGVELALPGVGTVSGTPSEEMIAAEVSLARKRQPAAAKAAAPRAKKVAAPQPSPEPPSIRGETTTAGGAVEGGRRRRRSEAATEVPSPPVAPPPEAEQVPAKRARKTTAAATAAGSEPSPTSRPRTGRTRATGAGRSTTDGEAPPPAKKAPSKRAAKAVAKTPSPAKAAAGPRKRVTPAKASVTKASVTKASVTKASGAEKAAAAEKKVGPRRSPSTGRSRS